MQRSQAWAEQSCALGCNEAGVTPVLLLSKQAALSWVHVYWEGCDFLLIGMVSLFFKVPEFCPMEIYMAFFTAWVLCPISCFVVSRVLQTPTVFDASDFLPLLWEWLCSSQISTPENTLVRACTYSCQICWIHRFYNHGFSEQHWASGMRVGARNRNIIYFFRARFQAVCIPETLSQEEQEMDRTRKMELS